MSGLIDNQKIGTYQHKNVFSMWSLSNVSPTLLQHLAQLKIAIWHINYILEKYINIYFKG
jgi:hypothetical protein